MTLAARQSQTNACNERNPLHVAPNVVDTLCVPLLAVVTMVTTAITHKVVVDRRGMLSTVKRVCVRHKIGMANQSARLRDVGSTASTFTCRSLA